MNYRDVVDKLRQGDCY